MSSQALVNGNAMAYVDEGDGPPVVLVHGNPTWSFYWRSLTEALPAAGLRAIAMDHIGMGHSARPPAASYSYTLSSRVDDFGAFVEQLLPTGTFDLVVHDWGGAIALSWAIDHPERVGRIVLLNTGAFPLPPGKGIPLPLRAARWPIIGSFAVTRLNAFCLGALVLGTGRAILPREARRGLLAPYRGRGSRVAVAAFVNDIPTGPGDPSYGVLQHTGDSLGKLADKPMLICWGMRDFVFDAAILAQFEAAFPQATVRRYPAAGHYVLEDAAASIVSEVVSFLGLDRE